MIIKREPGERLSFWCPGCNDLHTVSVAAGRWKWNGSADRPSFQPSVLVRSGHFITDHRKPGDPCWCTFYAEHPGEDSRESSLRFKCVLCHSFVTDGQIRFLDDCSHGLRGKTVPLPHIPAAYADD